MSREEIPQVASASDPKSIEYIDLQNILRPPVSRLRPFLRFAGGLSTIILLIYLPLGGLLMLYEYLGGEVELPSSEPYRTIFGILAGLFFISCIGTILHLGSALLRDEKWQKLRNLSRIAPRTEFDAKNFPGLSTQVDMHATSAEAIVQRVNEYCQKTSRPKHDRLKPPTPKSLALRVLGYALIIVGAPGAYSLDVSEKITEVLMPSFASSLFWPTLLTFTVSLMAVGLGGSAIYYARRMRQHSAAELLDKDNRPPVLYLRSFQAEQLNLRKGLSESNVWARFEELLTDRFSQFGPFIAVGEPGEAVPTIGAARAYFDGNDWQTAVAKFMQDARLIVFLLGLTPWLGWEIKKAISDKHIHKTIMLLPPAPVSTKSFMTTLTRKGHFASREEDSAKRLNSILNECFEGTPWQSSISHADLKAAIAMYFNDGGKVTVIRSDCHEKPDYELAIILACYGTIVNQTHA